MEELNPTRPTPAERVRQLLFRNGLESNRFREAVAYALHITPTEANALALLSLGQRLCPSHLGQQLGLSSGGTTALIQRLESRAYITRAPHPTDARSTLLAPTSMAISDLRRLYAPLIARLDELIHTLDEQERATVVRFLNDACEEISLAIENVQPAERVARDVSIGPAPDLWA